MQKIGKFITIEGQDGAGKSTMIKVVDAILREQEIDLITTREPGGTQLGESLRGILLDTHDYKISDTAELLMIFAARAQHLDEIIMPALNKGSWVLSDRFTDATYAYQGGGRELSKDHIAALETLVQESLRPDLTLVLDLPVELGVKRAGQRSAPDRFEKEQFEFKNRVRSAYLELAEQHPQRIKIIDAAQGIELVADAIQTILIDFIEEVTS